MKNDGLFGHCRRVAGGLLVAGFLALLSSSGHGGSASAGEGQGEYLTQATERLIKLVAKANNDGFKLQNNSFSLGGGWLTQSTDTWVPMFTVNLERGKEYRFLAAGDNDARDVDLEIVNPNNKVVARDEATNSEAVVSFRPLETGRHLIRLRLYDSNKKLPCACLGVVLSK